MTGNIVNFCAILIGSLIGVSLRRGISQELSLVLLKAQGLAITVIGFNGVISAMFTANTATGKLSADGALLLLISLVGGCVIGEMLRIDDRLNSLGDIMEKRIGSGGFAKGFVTSSVVFTSGAMGVVGSINDGLTGDSSILYVKSLINLVGSMVMASGMGIGVMFSAIPVLLWQGSFAVMASMLSSHITSELLDVFCMVGYSIVIGIGLNFLCNVNLKVANLLPALAFPVIYYFAFLVGA